MISQWLPTILLKTSPANPSNTKTEGVRKSIASTANNVTSSSQEGNKPSQVKGLSPEIIEFLDDFKNRDTKFQEDLQGILPTIMKLKENPELKNLEDLPFDRFENEIKKYNALTSKEFQDIIIDNLKKSIAEQLAPEKLENINLEETIKSLDKKSLDKKQELSKYLLIKIYFEANKEREKIENILKPEEKIKELPKELIYLLNLNEKFQNLASSVEMDSRDTKLVSEINETLKKALEVLNKIKDNNNDLNQLLSELKKEYYTFSNQKCIKGLINKFDEPTNKYKDKQNIPASEIIKMAKMMSLNLVLMYTHHYFYILLNETAEKIKQ